MLSNPAVADDSLAASPAVSKATRLRQELARECRSDRQRLCADTAAGSGRVQSCLSARPQELRASCRRALRQLQALALRDFRVQRPFSRACATQLRRLRCLPAGNATAVGLVTAVLCLHAAVAAAGPTAVAPKCRQATLAVRKQFSADPQLLPSVRRRCSSELSACQSAASAGGRRQLQLQCILGSKRRRCRRAVGRLLLVAMPTEQLSVDPALLASCQATVSSRCSQSRRVYFCLKNLVAKDASLVGDECQGQLEQLQLYEQSDLRLNWPLYRACLPAVRACPGPHHWRRPLRFGRVHACLLAANATGPASGSAGRCRRRLRRSLALRVKREQLDPRLSVPCAHDVSALCRNSSDQFRCLSAGFQSLGAACRSAVVDAAASADADIRLSPDPQLARGCWSFARRHCDSTDASLLCLEQRLGDAGLPTGCRSALLRHQRLALRDWRAASGFSRACGADIRRLCGSDASATAEMSAAIGCLTATVVGKASEPRARRQRERRVSGRCWQQLLHRLRLQQEEPSLDQRLWAACASQLLRLCARRGRDKLDCLLARQSQLTDDCRDAAISSQQLRTELPGSDRRLLAACAGDIKRDCGQRQQLAGGWQLLACLRHRMHSPTFSANCFHVVTLRLAQQQVDLRLNAELRARCGFDIRRHCRRPAADSSDAEGAVTKCLREAAVQGRLRLRAGCRSHLQQIVREFNLNYRLQPRLAGACGEAARRLCSSELSQPMSEPGSHSGVVSCLQQQLADGRVSDAACASELRLLLRETAASVRYDPQLLHACASEIARLCALAPLAESGRSACAVGLFSDPSVRSELSPGCWLVLRQRLQLLKAVRSQLPGQPAGRLLAAAATSHWRGRLLLLICSGAALLLLLGFCTGRVSKRPVKRL